MADADNDKFDLMTLFRERGMGVPDQNADAWTGRFVARRITASLNQTAGVPSQASSGIQTSIDARWPSARARSRGPRSPTRFRQTSGNTWNATVALVARLNTLKDDHL